jgi:thiol-disulfide isomerase/thioredoxin
LLAEQIARSYGDRVRFEVEDLGASPKSKRFGIDKYPAIVVDDALVSRPEDFYEWNGPKTGRYVPWSDLANRRRFQADLRAVIDARLAGRNVSSLKVTKSAAPERHLPANRLVDLEGKAFTFADLRGRPVLVEVWATWCPPCLATLEWSKRLDRSKVHLVGIAVESERKDIDAVIAKVKPPARMVIGSRELLDAFAAPPSIPTLFLADRDGKIVRIFYGAPATLHADIERELARLK